MIDGSHMLPLIRQAQQLGISRGSVYYLTWSAAINDRRVLGMKGTMSELELSILRTRSFEALKVKALLRQDLGLAFIRPTSPPIAPFELTIEHQRDVVDRAEQQPAHEAAEPPVYRLPGRKVVRQHPPGEDHRNGHQRRRQNIH